MELRFITVRDSSTLSPVPAGVYAVVEFIAFPQRGKSIEDGLNDAFMAIEMDWVGRLGAKPHIGKQFGFAKVDGVAQPFQPSVVCKVYSDATKAAFNAYRMQGDPAGLFFGGMGAIMLSNCPHT